MQEKLEIIVEKYDWEFYLSRPYSFLMSTWWHEVYASQLVQSLVNARVSKSLLISNNKIVTKYVSKREWAKVKRNFTTLIAKEPEKFLLWLSHAERLFSKVDAIVKEKRQLSVPQCIKLLNEVTVYGTFVPLFGGQWLKQNNRLYAELQTKITLLRAKSYYPIVYSKLFLPSLKRLFRENNIPPGHIEYATLHEVLNKNFQELKTRKELFKSGKEFAFFSDGIIEKVFLQNSFKSIFKSQQKGHETILRGKIAFAGIATGPARIVSSLKILSRQIFKKGDVLIAASTNPSLVPLMRKAAAIVTDEGGITSHAAIISRELGIPCIIGTKIATKVFKDGDVIEVDANMGIVKKL